MTKTIQLVKDVVSAIEATPGNINETDLSFLVGQLVKRQFG